MTTPFAPTIRTQSELRDAWQHLMGPWDHSGPSVWMMLIHDDRPLPQLTEIAEAGAPDPEMLVGLSELMRMLEDQVVPGGRFAFLRSRPGPDAVTPADRQWAAGLYAAAGRAGVSCEVIHLATRGSIRPIPPDDVDFLATSAEVTSQLVRRRRHAPPRRTPRTSAPPPGWSASSQRVP